MESNKLLEKFWDYVIFYPDEDEPDFDGVHYGGIKGIREDAPETAKKAFEEYQDMVREAEKNRIKL